MCKAGYTEYGLIGPWKRTFFNTVRPSRLWRDSLKTSYRSLRSLVIIDMVDDYNDSNV